ncbi:hypothetical protein [Kineococcus arenarius]|uniref:hypothetical protein n=1 Tax=Kineococcus sp. SYSU DK007 TaxID=3383128 RepID=UPI003D7EEF3B
MEFMDVPQALVLGADGASARRLSTAMERGAPDTQGDAAPMSLSPDGSTVAVGDWDAGAPTSVVGTGAPEPADVALVDAATGDVRTLPLPDASAALPLAWSPDSRRLAYLSPTGPAHPFGGPGHSGQLLVLDVASGRTEPVPGAGEAISAAFSPDGRLLAVQRDGEVAFLAASEEEAATVPAPVAGDALLAWRSSGEVLVQDVGASSSATDVDFTVSSVDLGTGAARPFTRVPTGSGDYAVVDFELATGLTQRAEHVLAVPRADRGQPPLLLHATGVLLAAGAGALVAHRLTRRRVRRRAPIGAPA